MTIAEMKAEIRQVEILLSLDEIDPVDAAAAIIELQKSIIHALEKEAA